MTTRRRLARDRRAFNRHRRTFGYRANWHRKRRTWRSLVRYDALLWAYADYGLARRLRFSPRT